MSYSLRTGKRSEAEDTSGKYASPAGVVAGDEFTIVVRSDSPSKTAVPIAVMARIERLHN